jgi:hypothetical protein
MSNRIEGDLIVTGRGSFGSLNVPADVIGNEQMNVDDPLERDKLAPVSGMEFSLPLTSARVWDNLGALLPAAASETLQIGTRAKVGAAAGWVVGAADNLPYVGTLPASQTGSTLVIPIDGLRIGDTITGFRVVGQVESAGNAVTIDGDLRAVTNVAAEPTDASIGTMTQVNVTADTAVSQQKTGLAEVVTSGKTYYLKLTATTGAATDIILLACEVTTQSPGASGDDLGIYAGTFATDAPQIKAGDVKTTSSTRYARFLVPLPAEYEDGGPVTIRLRAGMETTVADGSCTIDVEAYRPDGDGGISADLCSTAAQSINSLTEADKDFVITPTSLVAGDWLDVRVAITYVDTATGTAVIPRLTEIKRLCQLRG